MKFSGNSWDTSRDVLVKSYRLWYDVTNHEKRGGIDHDRY